MNVGKLFRRPYHDDDRRHGQQLHPPRPHPASEKRTRQRGKHLTSGLRIRLRIPPAPEPHVQEVLRIYPDRLPQTDTEKARLLNPSATRLFLLQVSVTGYFTTIHTPSPRAFASTIFRFRRYTQRRESSNKPGFRRHPTRMHPAVSCTELPA